jgi:hypothetical protein
MMAYKTRKRRAISQIMGTLFMLAIVVPVGTVIVTKGLNEVGEIGNRLASGITYQNEGGAKISSLSTFDLIQPATKSRFHFEM